MKSKQITANVPTSMAWEWDTKMTNSLIVRTMDDAERAAKAMSASGFFADSKSAAQAVVKILAGSELGFGPFASMTGVHIIQNRPTLAANLIAAAVKRSGKYNYRVIQHTDKICSIDFYEGTDRVGNSTYTWEEAQAAQLTIKDNWKKFPRNMLFARAISNGQKWYAPDAFNGATVYTPDELGATEDAEGNIVGMIANPEPVQVSDGSPIDIEMVSQETGEITEPVELIDPMSAEWVEYAAKVWNISSPEAAKQIASRKLGKKFDKQEFIELVNGS